MYFITCCKNNFTTTEILQSHDVDSAIVYRIISLTLALPIFGLGVGLDSAVLKHIPDFCESQNRVLPEKIGDIFSLSSPFPLCSDAIVKPKLPSTHTRVQTAAGTAYMQQKGYEDETGRLAEKCVVECRPQALSE